MYISAIVDDNFAIVLTVLYNFSASSSWLSSDMREKWGDRLYLKIKRILWSFAPLMMSRRFFFIILLYCISLRGRRRGGRRRRNFAFSCRKTLFVITVIIVVINAVCLCLFCLFVGNGNCKNTKIYSTFHFRFARVVAIARNRHRHRHRHRHRQSTSQSSLALALAVALVLLVTRLQHVNTLSNVRNNKR